MWLALTMILTLAIACKPQGTHSEEKFGSKLTRGATKGADELTAIKKLVNKGNKTDDEWGELAAAVIKGGAKGDAIINRFALLSQAEKNAIGKLLKSDTSNKLIRDKLADQLVIFGLRQEENIQLMRRVFPQVGGITERADIFAKLHPGESFELLRSRVVVALTGDIPKPFDNVSDVVNRMNEFIPKHKRSFLREMKGNQARVLFIDDSGVSQLTKLEENINKAFRWEAQGVTAVNDSHILVDSIVLDLKKIGGRKGLQECCGEDIANEVAKTIWSLSRKTPARKSIAETKSVQDLMAKLKKITASIPPRGIKPN